MANLTNDPFTAISPSPATNSDLAGAEFPSFERIEATDPVGPTASNRQHATNEKRTLSLRDRINKMIEFLNLVDTTYLRKDGTTAKDTVAGLTADIAANAHTLTGLRAAVANGEAVRYDEFAAALILLNSYSTFVSVPTGSVTAFAMNTAPTGWVVANGTIYTSTGINPAEGGTIAYSGGLTWAGLAALKTALGSTWGGNGSTSFGVPDYRGRSLIGVGTGFVGGALTARAIGVLGGSETHALTTGELAAHTHSIPTLGSAQAGNDNGGAPIAASTGYSTGRTNSPTGSNGSGTPFSLMSPFGTALICIKT